MRIPVRRLAFALVLAGLACAHTQLVAQNPTPSPAPPPQPKIIHFKPVIIQSSRAEAMMTDLNDEELFAVAQTAMAAGDNQKAALHFERLADAFPNSKHRAASLHFAGLMQERMHDYASALERFQEAMKAYGTTAERAESEFKAADEYYFLENYDAAANELVPLTTAGYLPVVRQMDARVKLGVVYFTGGRLDDSEKVFHAAYDEMKDNLKDDYRDGYLPAQAQFYLGEIYRTRFVDVKVDPSTSLKESLMKDLEYKAEMLLSAQGHYLMSIRVGHPEWATASGFRVGELYEVFYEQIMSAPPPKDVEPDAIAAYHDELHRRLRNCLLKAISVYEKTLSTAERVGATNPFVAETRTQLDKMKTLLTDENATTGAATPASPSSGTPAEAATAPASAPDAGTPSPQAGVEKKPGQS